MGDASSLRDVLAGRRTLLVVAAPSEAAAICAALDAPAPTRQVDWAPAGVGDGLDLILSGVGQANAAGAAAAALARGTYGAVLSIGIGGVLPGDHGIELLDVVVAEASRFADEGVETRSGWVPIAERGFPPTAGLAGAEPMGVATAAELVAAASASGARRGAVACVSTCAGTDERAAEVVRRTGAVVEAMEGGAVGLAALRAGAGSVRFGEIRVVSNTTGGAQRWDLAGALARLGEATATLLRR